MYLPLGDDLLVKFLVVMGLTTAAIILLLLFFEKRSNRAADNQARGKRNRSSIK